MARMNWEYDYPQIAKFQGRRVVRISDGTLDYYCATKHPENDCITDFLASYDYNIADDEQDQLEDRQASLRASLKVDIFKQFEPSTVIPEYYAERR